MKKGLLGVFLFGLILVSLVINASVVSADNPFETVKKFFTDYRDGNTDFVKEYIKFLVLLLIVAIVYAVLSQVEFPDNAGLRFIIAVVVGLLATIFITTDELIASIQGYKAMGIAMVLFLPFIVFTGLTFLVSLKLHPFGIIIQRVGWLIYSIFLFLYTGILLLLKWIIPMDIAVGGSASKFWDSFFSLFLGDWQQLVMSGPVGNTTILLVLCIASITVFWIFVIKNEAAVHWISNQKNRADLMQMYDTNKRAKAELKSLSDMTRNDKKDKAD